MTASTMTNSSFSAIEFGPNDIMENVDPKGQFPSTTKEDRGCSLIYCAVM